MNEILCIHEMPVAWCATCKKIKAPEEEHETDGFWDKVKAAKSD